MAWPPRCPAWPTTAARTASPADSCGACARTKARGSVTCSSTSRSSCRTSPARKSRSARRAAPDKPGVYTVVYEYAQRDEGVAAGDLGSAAAVLAAARVAASARLGARRLELAGSARRLHPLRAAPRARSVDRIAGACGGSRAASRGCGSTINRSCSSVTASTSSASRPPSPAARRTSPSSWRATRKRRTRSSHRSACRCRGRSSCRATPRQCAPRSASAIRSSPSRTTAITAAASRSG